jgi:lipoprotein-releasing system ATP-binding protein
MADLVEIKKLVKNYFTQAEELKILQGIDFSINYNETVSITGESGTGKSTFLNMIGGLDSITSGSIKIEDVELTNLDEDEMTIFRNRKIGFIFQSHYLLEEFTAIENITIPYLMHNYNKKKATDRGLELLNFMGMDNRKLHYPSQLSGGEKQRIAIARAFINDPLLILADEPTGNLDEKNAYKVLELLLNLTSREKHSLILVSHSTQIVKMTHKNYHLEGGKLSLIRGNS